MPDILDIIDPSAGQKEINEAVRNNMLAIGKLNLKTGTYLLVDTIGITNQTVSSAIYVPLTDFQGSFNSAGGVVLVEFAVLKDSTAGTVNITLFIDDEEKAWAYSYETAGSLLETMIISRWMQLNAGNHKYQVKCKVTAANAAIGPGTSGTKGTLSILEFVRG